MSLSAAQYGQITAKNPNPDGEDVYVETYYPSTPDFGAAARSMGWYGEGPIDDPKKVAAALKRAIAKVKAGTPALIDTITQRR